MNDIFNPGKLSITTFTHPGTHTPMYSRTDVKSRVNSCINETIESFTICYVCCCVHGRKHQPTVPAAPAARTATTSPVTMRARLHQHPSVFCNIFVVVDVCVCVRVFSYTHMYVVCVLMGGNHISVVRGFRYDACGMPNVLSVAEKPAIIFA